MDILKKVMEFAEETSINVEDTFIVVYWNAFTSKGKIISECTEERNDLLKKDGYIPTVCFLNGNEYPVVDI